MALIDITDYSIIIVDDDANELRNEYCRASDFKDDTAKLAFMNKLHNDIMEDIGERNIEEDNEDYNDDEDDEEEDED